MGLQPHASWATFLLPQDDMAMWSNNTTFRYSRMISFRSSTKVQAGETLNLFRGGFCQPRWAGPDGVDFLSLTGGLSGRVFWWVELETASEPESPVFRKTLNICVSPWLADRFTIPTGWECGLRFSGWNSSFPRLAMSWTMKYSFVYSMPKMLSNPRLQPTTIPRSNKPPPTLPQVSESLRCWHR